MKVCPTCQEEFLDEMDFCPDDGMKLRKIIAEDVDPLIGQTLDGRWRIEKKIGEGGMGNVYEGHQKSVNRRVAIKTLRPQLSDSDEFTDRFFREARLATKISHPHCVTVLDFGQADNGTLYLAMEYLDGVPLTDRILDAKITFVEIYKIGIQIASALTAAHEKQIVHRDLKPDNIFVLNMSNGETFIKVLDFGIAKALDSKTQVTKAGMIFGTPEYMSPEQCRSEDVDGRSDLYGLGCILYELLGGRPPFDAKTPMAILLSHVNDEVAPIASVASDDIPNALSNTVMKLLQKNPDERFASAKILQSVLEEELERFLHPENFDSQGFASRPSPSLSLARDIVDPSTQTKDGAGLHDLITLANTREEERIIAPKRSKLPLLLVLLFIGASAFGFYHFALKAPEGLSTQSPFADAVETEEQISEEEAMKTQIAENDLNEKEATSASKTVKKESALEKSNLSTLAKIKKDRDIAAKKLKKVETKNPKNRPRRNAKKSKGKPHPDGVGGSPRKPRKAKPDPNPDTLSSPLKNALDGLKKEKKTIKKLERKINRKIKNSNKKLNDTLEGLMH